LIEALTSCQPARLVLNLASTSKLTGLAARVDASPNFSASLKKAADGSENPFRDSIDRDGFGHFADVQPFVQLA
jgi:hypothetical protein